MSSRDDDERSQASANEDFGESLQEVYGSGRIKFASIPLGTGNDLARSLGWGHVYPGTDKLKEFLDAIASKTRKLTWLDRWRASFVTSGGLKKEWQNNYMFNYCHIGYTADISYQFHVSREAHPEFYKNPVTNKGKYVQLGASQLLSRTKLNS